MDDLGDGSGRADPRGTLTDGLLLSARPPGWEGRGGILRRWEQGATGRRGAVAAWYVCVWGGGAGVCVSMCDVVCGVVWCGVVCGCGCGGCVCVCVCGGGVGRWEWGGVGGGGL